MLNLKKLKEIREKKGLSQSAFARMASIAPSHYNNIELGKRSPSVHTLSLILQCLDIDIQDIWDTADGTLPPILPIRDDGIIIEKNIITLKYNFPNTPETLQYLDHQIKGTNDIDPDFQLLIEKWRKTSDETKAKIIKLLEEDGDDKPLLE